MMHQPMCPVEISIVNNKHYGEYKKEIEPSILIDVFIKKGMFSDCGYAKYN
jgi:hypothetical protein